MDAPFFWDSSAFAFSKRIANSFFRVLEMRECLSISSKVGHGAVM